MKKINLTLFVLCLGTALVASCSKDALTPGPGATKGEDTVNHAKDNVSPVIAPDPILGHVNTAVTLTGQWTQVKDSITYSSAANNGLSSDVYNGNSADYFQFTNDGKLYMQENGVIDKANYTISGDRSIIINYLVSNGVPSRILMDQLSPAFTTLT